MKFHLTTAGLAAIVNPENTGVNALVIDRIGVSAVVLPGDPDSHEGMLALPNELKRLATFAGVNVGDNTIHVTIRDESPDAYSLRTFGLYASTGVLLAYVTSAEPISEKTPSSMTLIAADLAFTASIAAEVVFGDTSWINPPATTEMVGVVELATKEEARTGTDAVRAVTPLGLSWVLQGFSALGHTHSADDTTSGVFAVGRIPALAMEKITGLATALAGKSSVGHTHAAGEVVSGTFDVARIPDLLMAKITGLAEALAGKSNTGHNHNAGDVNAGTFDVARIPDLVMAKITGLIDALAGKSNIGHNHSADDTTSGVFAVGRIPALGMEKITGLAAALANKLNGTDFTWALLPGRPNVAVMDTDVLFNSVQCRQASSPTVGRVYLGDQSGGSRWLIYDGSRYQVVGAPLWVNGSPVHTQATFDPASKAAAVHTHTASDITDLLDRYWPAGELRLFELNAIPSGVRAVVANGSVVSRTTYARLFAAIGTRYGAGDGATTFQLPDWRGVFFRGLDLGRGFDPDRVLGALQMSQNLAHFHTINARSNANTGNGYVEDADSSGDARTALTASEGGLEARPINQALLACITY